MLNNYMLIQQLIINYEQNKLNTMTNPNKQNKIKVQNKIQLLKTTDKQ